MKKFFNDKLITSIRVDCTKGISGIKEIFSLGVDSAHITYLSENSLRLCDPKNIEGELAPEKQISLNELFKSFKDKKFIIEIFGNIDNSDELTETIKRNSMDDKVLIWAENQKLIKKIREKNPEIATAMTPKEFFYLYFLFKTGFLYFKKIFKADCLISIEAIGISYILNQSLIKELTGREVFSMALADSSENQIKRLIDSGCSGFVFLDAEHFNKSKYLLNAKL